MPRHVDVPCGPPHTWEGRGTKEFLPFFKLIAEFLLVWDAKYLQMDTKQQQSHKKWIKKCKTTTKSQKVNKKMQNNNKEM